jgi:hypothetical protein
MRGAHVHLVAADSHARLAARFLGVTSVSAERSEVAALWQESPAPHLTPAWSALLDHVRPAVIVSFIADEQSDAGRRWIRQAQRVIGANEILCVGPPGSASRLSAWDHFEVSPRGHAPPRRPASGPLIAHVGAGSRDKMWPMERWRELAEELRQVHRPLALIAGEVERERFHAEEHRMFAALGGRTLDSLDELADTLISAAGYIGGDTGPTHLAAQLGIPTLALFGPTDPRTWSPIGPAVHVLSPPEAAPMTWLRPLDVRLGLNKLLGTVSASK